MVKVYTENGPMAEIKLKHVTMGHEVNVLPASQLNGLNCIIEYYISIKTKQYIGS